MVNDYSDLDDEVTITTYCPDYKNDEHFYKF